jgi:hypothetical protein
MPLHGRTSKADGSAHRSGPAGRAACHLSELRHGINELTVPSAARQAGGHIQSSTSRVPGLDRMAEGAARRSSGPGALVPGRGTGRHRYPAAVRSRGHD